MANKNKDLIPIQSKELVRDAVYFCNSISMIVITTQKEYLSNCELTKKVTKYSKDIDVERKALIKPLNTQKDTINSYFNDALKPLKNLREKLRNSLEEYTDKQEQKKIEAQRKVDAEAEKERLRLEAQAKRDAEKARKAAEEGNMKKAEEFHERSTIRQDMAENVVPTEIPKEIPKVEGISYRTDWSAKIVDRKKFIEYCIKYDKTGYLEINIGLLNKYAKEFKDSLVMPGIEFYSTKVQITR